VVVGVSFLRTFTAFSNPPITGQPAQLSTTRGVKKLTNALAIRDYWGPVTDGIASWESAWPMRAGLGGAYPGDVSIDIPVLNGARARGKTYAMRRSSFSQTL
jgi:hypothetical protein